MIATVDKVALINGVNAQVLLKKLAKQRVYPITSNYSLKLIDHKHVQHVLEKDRKRARWLITLGIIAALVIAIAVLTVVL